MIRTLAFAGLVGLATASSAWAADMIKKTSPHSVAETIDRLQAAVEGAGATVFARVDHAAGAAKVDMELRPTQMLMFGNPKLGTPAMLDGQTAGLDLPLRVLAYEDSDGTVHVAYHDPASLAATHALPGDAKYIQMMTGALDKLTSKAVATE
ncbi:hypothetical protein So717_38050 [Roseobacter cerasinus]|uniref:DUF302 domain-containing protein n=1 Tax=Roseobacter cerasinus TaxID=2602289 RepID=A0A640VWN1_9RHOB|nr:DUF302 domain-containing protein [Roseobacter cerasinus]GFE52052.1 hypothetical protein So717_38050 [Roseobacter cerasinus]